MTAVILPFYPRTNQAAERAFWKGPPDPLETMAIEIMNVALLSEDTAPSEMNPDNIPA